MIELPNVTFCKILPELPKPSKLRRQVRKDGGYDMVPAYTDEEMFKYGEVCAAEAREQMREECKAVCRELEANPENSHDYQCAAGWCAERIAGLK